MTFKRKKQIILLMLTTILTTSCHKEDTSFREDSFSQVESIMNKRSFYQEESIFSYNKTNEEFLGKFYKKYLDQFVNYMDSDQYENFLNLVRCINERERSNLNETFYNLHKILEDNDSEYGRGIYSAFNTRIVCEEIFSSYKLTRLYGYHNINTLKSLINNDEEFYRCLFSKDIDAFIDCIVKYTGPKSRSAIEELILQMDVYSDLVNETLDLSSLAENDNCQASELLQVYEKRLNDLMHEIITNSFEYRPDFNNTLYGRLLKDSNYTASNTYKITQDIMSDQIIVQAENAKKDYYLSIPRDYLYADYNIEELEKMMVNNIIETVYNQEESAYIDYYQKLAFNLMLNLIYPNMPNDEYLTTDQKRLKIYEILSEYFEDERDFNIFFLNLASRSETGFDRYFEIFKSQLVQKGVSYEDFERYLSLENLALKEQIIFYDYPLESGLSYYEIDNMKKEEYESFVIGMLDNDLFLNFKYLEHLKELRAILGNNNLGFSLVYGPDCRIIWKHKRIDAVGETANYVISELVEPKTMSYHNYDIIYYDIPENFENAQAVDAFYNIASKLTTRYVEGYHTSIIDNETGEEKTIFIAGEGNNKDDYESIRFMTPYKKFKNEKENNKKLTLGDTYE